MIRIIVWLKKHPVVTAMIIIAAFFLPLLIVHCLFKWTTEYIWLTASWSAGDVLGYIAAFEAFLGSVVLGAVTVYQSDRANEINVRLSKENNYLQRISIQQMLPLLRVTSITVEKANATTFVYSQNKACSLEIADVTTQARRETHLRTYLPLLGSQENGYHKTVKFTLENISGGAISQIAIDSIEFSGFKYKGEYVDKVTCVGIQEAKYISWLILPGDHMDVTVDINFDNPLYKAFWEFDDFTSIGCFDMCLYITNKSLSGITYREKIYIEKAVGFKERVMYKAFEEEEDNA